MSKYINSVETVNDGWKIGIKIPGNENVFDGDIVKILNKLNITVNTKSNIPMCSNNVIANYLQIGLTGSINSTAGYLLYPAGYWNDSTTYSKGSNSIPYVYHNNEYFVLSADSCIGKKPNKGSSYWTKIESFKSIQTEFILAPNATFGNSSGAVFYKNYLYSQQGLDGDGNRLHYSQISDIDSIFETPTTGPATLTGHDVFKPNLSVNFYDGEISCNKLCEQYDYFHVIDINKTYTNGDYPVYQNTYKMQTNKSHNICVTSRNIPYYRDDYRNYTSLSKIPCYTRPGVIVLPEYDNTYSSDGTRICINYPSSPNSGYDGVSMNEGQSVLKYDLVNKLNGVSLYYYNGGCLSLDGYILVCADPDIFNPNMYENGIFKGNLEANCFVWNGLKSKFILMCKGSELLLRSVLLKHRCSTSTITRIRSANGDGWLNNYNNYAYPDGDYSIVLEESDISDGYEIIKTLPLSYTKGGQSEWGISSNGIPDIHIIEKIIGLQWVIENSNSFNPIPMNIQIDNFVPGQTINSLYTFNGGLPGYINSPDFICLGSGSIDYEYDTGKQNIITSSITIDTAKDDNYSINNGTTGDPPSDAVETISYISEDSSVGIVKQLKKPIFQSSAASYNFENKKWENMPTCRLNINTSADTSIDNFDFVSGSKIYTSTCIVDGWDIGEPIDDELIAYY